MISSGSGQIQMTRIGVLQRNSILIFPKPRERTPMKELFCRIDPLDFAMPASCSGLLAVGAGTHSADAARLLKRVGQEQPLRMILNPE